MKFLLLIVLAVAAVLVWRRLHGSPRPVRQQPAARPAERMVKCAHCGVNQPLSESVLTQGRYYCCDAHRHEAESRDS
jgi:uncharacterized protein